MESMLWIIGLILFLITLPGTIELAVLTFPGLAGIRRRPPAAGEDIRLTVVIPAHNEEQGLPITLQSLLACDHPLAASDLHVIADNCADGTADVARAAGCTVMERHDTRLRGKGYALNWAFQQIQQKDYDALIVVDADTRVDTNFLDAYRNLFAHGADAGQAAYRVGNPEANFRTRLMHIAFLAFNFLRPVSRQNLGFSAGILGNGFALSMKTVREIPYDSFSIVEDLEYHTRLVRAGKKVEFLPDTSVWSDMPETSEAAQTQRERWEGGRLRMTAEQTPKLAAGVLSGRLRLLEPLLELLLLPLSYHLMLLTFLVFVGRGGFFTWYAVAGLLMVVLHVVIAMLVGKASAEDWKALMSAPFYILWKIANIVGIVKTAGKGADWNRTSRDSKQEP
ncbi:MAG TPA: glycosyltransferase [Gammaproteobacteria bacterium]|nr:glycosyltransferase [Gammaproteobacteria bacterium]